MIAGHNEAIPPEVAARNADQALARVRTERKGSFRIALAVIHYWPLFSLHPPLPELRPAPGPVSSATASPATPGGARNGGWSAPWSRSSSGSGTSSRCSASTTTRRSSRRFNSSRSRCGRGKQDFYCRLPSTGRSRSNDPGTATRRSAKRRSASSAQGPAEPSPAYTMAEQGHEVLLVERGEHVHPSLFCRGRAAADRPALPAGNAADLGGFPLQRAAGQLRRRFDHDQQRDLFRSSRRQDRTLEPQWRGTRPGPARAGHRDGFAGSWRCARWATSAPAGHHPAAKVIEPALARIGNQVRLAMPEPLRTRTSESGPDRLLRLRQLQHRLRVGTRSFPCSTTHSRWPRRISPAASPSRRGATRNASAA